MLNSNVAVTYCGDWAKIFVDGVCVGTVLSTAIEKAITKLAGGQK